MARDNSVAAGSEGFENGDVSRLERSTVLVLVLITVIAACGAFVQIVSAQWAPLQRMFLGF